MSKLTAEIRKHFTIYMPIDQFESYCDLIEDHFEQNRKKFYDIADTNDEAWDHNFFAHLDNLITYPSIHRNSLFISLYSFFEHQLTSLCSKLKESENISISISDLKGNGIEKAQKYLKKVVGIDFPDNSIEWDTLKKYNLIRNCIVHNQGSINEYNKPAELKNIIENMDNVREDKDNFIQLQKDFCYEFLKIMKDFLSLLFDKVVNHFGGISD